MSARRGPPLDVPARGSRLTVAAFAAAIALSTVTTGCVAGRRFAASPEEYATYRRARASDSIEDRLEAAQLYLVKYPQGAWTDEVQAFFARAEPIYWAGAKGSIPLLEAYIRSLPHGPNAKEAALRLRDLKAAEKAERTELRGAAEAIDENVEREAERRKGVRARLSTWLGAFLDPAVFARPLIDAKASLIVPWSLGLPWPLCARPEGDDAPKLPAGAVRRCTKLLQLDYRAADGGKQEERQALVEIAIAMDEAGRPIEVSIGGPDLYLRLQETVTARAASASDPEAKLAGAELAVEIAHAAFASALGDTKSCKKTADADVLRLSCKGVTLRVLASALDGEDDRFVIRAAP